jgi:hypothetical protein
MFVINDVSWFPVKKEHEKFRSQATGYAPKKGTELLHQTLHGRNVGPA